MGEWPQNCAKIVPKKPLFHKGMFHKGIFHEGFVQKGIFHEGFVHKGIFHEGFVHKGIFHEGEFCQNAEATLGYPRALALVTTCKPHNRRVTGAPPRIDEKEGEIFPTRGGSASNRSGSHQVGRILPKRRPFLDLRQPSFPHRSTIKEESFGSQTRCAASHRLTA